MKRLLFVLMILASAAKAQITSLSQVFSAPPIQVTSEIQPVDKAELNYTVVMFEHPYVSKAVFYKIIISAVNDKDTTEVMTVKDTTMAVQVSGLEFGKKYSWYYVACTKKGKQISKSRKYSFSILPLPREMRFRLVHDDSAKYNDGYISFDYSEVITDRSGQVVWFLPDSKAGDFMLDDEVRDIRLTPGGTFTFLTTKNCFEITIDAKTLWRGPKVTTQNVENFHHGFQKLSNGHYMVMGNHTVTKVFPGDTTHYKAVFGVILEYDRLGNVIWKWEADKYFQDADLMYHKTADGKIDVSTHMNAFFSADSGKYVYAGFRDANRIIRIDRATGLVMNSYGERMPSGDARNANGFFRKQHDVNVLPNGNIAVFNNDSILGKGVVSSVVIFSQANDSAHTSQIVWQFPCKFDSLSDGKSEKGGNVDLLPNGNYLINMGSLNRCIEVTPDKKVVWDVFEESWSKEENKWIQFRQYRSHYFSTLYPCYYTVHMGGQVSASDSLRLVITNEGDNDDHYSIQYKVGAAPTWTTLTTTNTIGKDQSARISFMRPAEMTGDVQFRITSFNNPDFVRTITAK